MVHSPHQYIYVNVHNILNYLSRFSSISTNKMDSPSSTPSKHLQNTPKKRKRFESITDKSLKYFKSVSEEDAKELNDVTKTHRCVICGKHYNGTKEWNLTSHLQTSHPSVYYEISTKKEPPEVKRLQFLQNCVEIISVNGRPFSYLRDSGFQAIAEDTLMDLKSAGCAINLTDHNLTQVKEHLEKTSQRVQKKIANETENRPLSLMVDIATRHRRSICGFSVQYVLNGQLKIRSIGMIELLDKHTGKYIAHMIMKRLNEFGICLKQIITITTDNGSNVLKMVRDINDHLKASIEKPQHVNLIDTGIANGNENQDADDLIEKLLCDEPEISEEEAYEQLFEEVEYNKDFSTLLNVLSEELSSPIIDIWDITGVNCVEHTLQLGIKDALARLSKEFKNVIMLCRRICIFLRLKSTSNAMNAVGVEYILPHLENETRWGSMYLMVRCIFFFIFIHSQ